MGTIQLMIAMILMVSSLASAKEFKISVSKKTLIHAVIQKENPHRNPRIIGDQHLHNKAYGLLQIRSPYLKDAVKIAGKKEIRHRWKKSLLSVRDMIDQEKAKWVFLVYLSHYGKLYTRATGKTPSVEVYARIHNGGPIGWKKKNTASYGKAVKRYAEAYQAERRKG